MSQKRAPVSPLPGPAADVNLMDALDDENDAVLKLPLSIIEKDPRQTRKHFDPEKLKELAESLRLEGQLQPGGAYPIQYDNAGIPSRWRILYGERRFRAAELLGWSHMAWKVFPAPKDENDLKELLGRLNKQEAENAQRVDLSAIEDAGVLKRRLEILRGLEPEAGDVDLVERVAAEKGLSSSLVYRLLDLLDAPKSLQDAILRQEIQSREVAFTLATYWSKLKKRQEAGVGASQRRELQFQASFRAWAAAAGVDPAAPDAPGRYARDLGLDGRTVRATLRAAEKIGQEGEVAFDEMVRLAVSKKWTAKEARARLSGAGNGLDGKKEPTSEAGLFVRSGAGAREKVVIHLGRLLAPASVSAEDRQGLVMRLRSLADELERAVPQDGLRTGTST